MTRRAHRPAGPARWAIAAALILGWFGLIALELTAHFHHLELAGSPAGPLVRLGDMLYAPLTFLAPQAEYAHGETLTWAGQIGRILGIALPVLTIAWTFQRRFLAHAARQILRFWGKGHVVVAGEAGSADRLCLASSEAGDVCVLLDPSCAAAHDRALDLQRAGVLLPAATPVDRQLREAARGDSARDVVAWNEDGAAGLAVAMAARHALSGGEREITVAIASSGMQRALRRAPNLLTDNRERLRPISEAGAAVREALSGTGLIEEARRLGQGAVTVRLHGRGTALRWAAEHILRHNWSLGLGPPTLVLDPEPPEDPWSAFLADARGIIAQGEVIFDPGQHPRIARAGRSGGAGEGEGGGGDPEPLVTRHLVDAGDDAATLEQALALAARQLQVCGDAAASVQAILRRPEAAMVLDGDAGLPLSPSIVIAAPRTLRDLLARPLDEAAARLHLEYARGQAGADLPASGAWRDLAETYVHANRAAADHRAVKAFDAANAGFPPRAAPDELVTALAMVEHRRWSAERLIEGWLPGPRDNRRQLHPNLAPWSALSEADREKDRMVVREALREAEDPKADRSDAGGGNA